MVDEDEDEDVGEDDLITKSHSCTSKSVVVLAISMGAVACDMDKSLATSVVKTSSIHQRTHTRTCWPGLTIEARPH